MPHSLEVHPVTRDNWDAFDRLFEAKGSPHYCWCTSYRARSAATLTSAQKKASVHGLVNAETPIGVIAMSGEEAVGWCSIAPRETYLRLERSRSMPRVTPPDTPTWAVLCFFVARPHRGRQVARALLQGAVAYAREQGAKIIEGYPFDTAGVSSTHRGHSSLFEAAKFKADGKRWYRRVG